MTNAIAYHDMKQNNECFMDFLYDFMDFRMFKLFVQFYVSNLLSNFAKTWYC